MLKSVLSAVGICTSTIVMAQSLQLSGSAITGMVAGSILEIDTPLGSKIPVRYGENGQMSGQAKDLAWYLGAAADSGKWWVASDQLCHKWSKWFKGETQCLRLSMDGQKVQWRSQDGTTGTASISGKLEVPALVAQGGSLERRGSGRAEVGVDPDRSVSKAKTADPEPKAMNPTVSPDAKRTLAAVVPIGPRPQPRASEATQKVAKKPLDIAAENPVSRQIEESGEAKPTGIATFRIANVERSDVLNVRHGPAADYPAIGVLPADGRGVKITGQCQTQWCPIQHQDVSGWVNRMFLASENEVASIGGSVGMAVPSREAGGDRRSGSDAPRSCLSVAARQLIDRIEAQFGAMRLVSTCRAGATIAGTGRVSRHASGNAIDFDAGRNKHAVADWLVANHRAGGTMTYPDMDHIHVDIGPHFVSLAGGRGSSGRWQSTSRDWQDSRMGLSSRR